MRAAVKFCIVVVVAALVSMRVASAAPPATPHGMALLYATRDVADVSLLQAIISLPRQKQNHSWYASWLMTLPEGNRSTEPFLQIGLLRQSGNDSEVWPFVAYRHEGGNLVFQSFTARRNSKALFQIDSLGSHITLRVDGQALFDTAKSAFFSKAQSAGLYFQLGDEVSAYGDRVAGVISDIEVRRPSGMWPYIPSCTYADSGLSILDFDGNWEGRGVFSAGPGAFHDTWDNSVIQQCG